MKEKPDRMHLVIGRLLQVGVSLSAGLVFIGALVYLFRHSGEKPNYAVFHSEPLQLRGVSGISRDVVSLSSRALIQLGLVALIATPVARVVFSMITFLRERDRLYATFTAVVLVLLLYSILASK
jgi:uncharacterized membrane protein